MSFAKVIGMVSIRRKWFSLWVLCTFLCCIQRAPAQSNLNALKEMRGTDIGETATSRATELAAALSKSKDVSLLQVLEAMNGASPMGRNWLQGIANSKFRAEGSKSVAELEKFLANTKNDSEARYKVLQWLTQGNPSELKKRLVSLSNDPSPEIRYASIESLMQETSDVSKLQGLLESARHPNQVVDLIKKLEDSKVTVDQAKHFGFILKWKLIGPFDHVGTKNFDKVFPVETDYVSGKFSNEYEGKKGKVEWKEYVSEAKDGDVDLTKPFDNEKGCIVYAYAEFDSPMAGPAEIRLGCINGHKIWVNGKLAMTNEVYHSSSQIDQYIEPIKLQKGANRILIKVCQNEQKEQWAQRYQFMFRITDETGKAIQPVQ